MDRRSFALKVRVRRDNVSQASCPVCGTGFDNGRTAFGGALRKRLLFGPERLIAVVKQDPAACDTCPACAHRFVSEDFLDLRHLVRARLRSTSGVYLLAIFIVVAVLVSATLGK